MLLDGFDATQVPEQMEFSALPEGEYVVIATASEEKATKAGTGSYLQFTLEVLDGPCKGRKLWSRLNLKNPNQTAVDIAQRELGAICKAVGVLKPRDSAELHNKPMLVSVAVERDDRNKESNVIKKYSPVNAGSAQAGAMPAFMAAAAPASGAPATPPWQR